MVYDMRPFLVNDRFADPVLLVDLRFAKRALLFDVGDVAALPRAKLRIVSDLFLSHAHMDHFADFDRLLRANLRQSRTIRVFGPDGITEKVGHRLAGYSWNLADGDSSDLRLVVTEVASATAATVTEFRLRHRFQPGDTHTRALDDGVILADDAVIVHTAVLDHKLPCLGFAVTERQRLTVLTSGLDRLGLKPGRWIDDLKAAIAAGAPPDTAIAVTPTDPAKGPAALPLADLAEAAIRAEPGRKVAYVVDAGPTADNHARIVALARGADILFIEAAFTQADHALAEARFHLTAELAGRIAAEAGVRRVEPIHLSLRYQDAPGPVLAEVRAAFARGAEERA